MDYLAGSGNQAAPETGNQRQTGGSTDSSTAKSVPLASGVGQENQQAAAPLPALAPSSGDAFDLSSYDPLQAHVLQLTASAGLANNPETGAPASAQQNAAAAQQAQTQQQQQQSAMYLASQQQQQQQVIASHPGAFLQPASAALQSMLHAPASVQPQANTASNTTNTQQFFSLAAAPLGALAPAPQPLLPSTLNPTPTPVVSGGSQVNSKQPLPSFPSIVSSCTNGSGGFYIGQEEEEKDEHKLPPNWDSMTPDQRRRWERNMREQQRSHRISQQIKELRSLLTDSEVPFKPNKYSILLSVSDYIRQLQSRAIMLDAEHRKLLDTIRQTSEMVNSGKMPEPEQTMSASLDANNGGNASEDMLLYVQGLDYKAVFEQSSAAMGIAALDGRILACNNEFETILGYPREELLRQSLFSVMQNHEEVFKAMGAMIKAEDITLASPLTGDVLEEKPPLYWSGVVSQNDENRLLMSISLTRSTNGKAKFFSCALVTD